MTMMIIHSPNFRTLDVPSLFDIESNRGACSRVPSSLESFYRGHVQDDLATSKTLMRGTQASKIGKCGEPGITNVNDLTNHTFWADVAREMQASGDIDKITRHNAPVLQDIKRAEFLADTVALSGGATWRPDYSLVDTVALGGYLVSVPWATVKVPTLEGHVLREYTEQARRLITDLDVLRTDGHRWAYCGAWNDGQGSIVLDVTVHVKDKGRAVYLGAHWGQTCVWNCAEGRSIYLVRPGQTSQVKTPNPGLDNLDDLRGTIALMKDA